MRKAKAVIVTDKPTEQRRIYGGSIYWLRPVRSLIGEQWTITADGVEICSPTTYEQALAGLDAVAPR